YKITIPEISAETYSLTWFGEVKAAQEAIPRGLWTEFASEEVKTHAQALSRQHPTVPIAIEAVWGSHEDDTNSFNEEQYQEVKRYLNGSEIEFPDDDINPF